MWVNWWRDWSDAPRACLEIQRAASIQKWKSHLLFPFFSPHTHTHTGYCIDTHTNKHADTHAHVQGSPGNLALSEYMHQDKVYTHTPFVMVSLQALHKKASTLVIMNTLNRPSASGLRCHLVKRRIWTIRLYIFLDNLQSNCLQIKSHTAVIKSFHTHLHLKNEDAQVWANSFPNPHMFKSIHTGSNIHKHNHLNLLTSYTGSTMFTLTRPWLISIINNIIIDYNW